MPAGTCPDCGSRLNAGTAFTGTRAPRSGDFSLCAYCGCALRFDAHGWSFVRRAGSEELQALGREQPETLRALRQAQRVIRRRRGQSRRRH